MDLTATYNGPASEPFTVKHSIPTPPSASVSDKTQYLDELRNAVTATQDQINQELTARMEQDKARSGDGKPAVDDAKEEENYGEEVQEED